LLAQGEQQVPTLIAALGVTLAYFALAELSSALAYAPTDAWTVWLASGLTLGLLLATGRARWGAMLAGAALGAAIFALVVGGTFADALGYAAIEIAGGVAGAWVATRAAGTAVRFESPRELGAFVLGVLVQALVGAVLAGAWTVASGGQDGMRTFKVWLIADVVGGILVAPLIITWSGFRAKRSGGLAMPQFAAGAIACALFLGLLYVLFSGDTQARFGGTVGTALTYLPVLFMSVIALTWGARGASFAAFAGALITLFNTIREHGPFAAADEYVGEAELEAQVFVAAVALMGLLVAALVARERRALREARDWRTRFESAIGAHRLMAYEWDPVGGAFVVTGDTASHLGVPPSKIASLADWLAHVSPTERDQTATAFGLRADGAAVVPLTYRVVRADGTPVTLVDEAQAVRDHEGTAYRITGIVRVASAS
jgi:integral membrane sensor domain MASE1